ncbi:MAG TPA: cytosine permease [Ktedonobacterales bacterium]|nr:cytosine permease [Ktedonobacterales bacterium]
MAVVTRGKQETFEVTGIERVAEEDRAHTQLRDTMWLWWSANSVVATVALGSLSFFMGLGFWGSVVVIVLFNIVGVLPVAFLSTLGPKTGLAQMPLTRFAYGLQGAKLPAIFNAIACIGWSAVNAIIGSSLLVAWSAGVIPQWAALLFLAIITTAVSVFGYFIVHRYERYAWIPMFVLFGYVFVASASHFNTSIPASLSGGALIASVLTFGGAIFGYAVGWSSYAADYTRRQPADSSSSTVFLYAFLGVTVPCILLETLGVLLTTSLASNAELPTAGQLISGNIGTGVVASIVLLLLAFSTIANNVPNDYSFALSTQVVGLRIPRWILTVAGAVAYVLVALALQANFNLNLEGFLLLIAYWLGSWSIIVILEHVLRRGIYPAASYEDASKLPPGIAAIASMVVGLVVAVLGVNQAATIGFEGPLSKALGDADIGFPLAIVVTGVLYFVLRRWELARFKR